MPSGGALLESIASDAIFITFHVSDGDISRWPENTRSPSATAREVNWHRKMTMEEKYACRWRNLIGRGIAKLQDKPDQEKYCLQSFPEGYWMFDHNKGPVSNIRHDLYLHGSKTVVRFRSPAEFIPHGYWLLTDPTLNRQNCGCKYCGGGGKKTQTEISEALGLPTNRGPTSVTGATRIRNEGMRRLSGRAPNTTAATGGPWVTKERRAPRDMDPQWRITSLELNLVSNSTRTSDLRSNRIFRLGELVWCLWNAQTRHTTKGKEVEQGPYLWPAVIIDYGLDVSVNRSLPFGSNGSHSIIQRRRYVLRRLGTDSLEPNMEYECTLTEDEILPWHAHKGHSSSTSSVSHSSQADSVIDPFTFALETAENLVKFWAVCDRLPIKVPLSTATAQVTREIPADSSNIFSPATSTLPSAYAESHHESTRSTPPSSIPYSVDTTPPQRSPVRLVPTSSSGATRIRIFSKAAGVQTSASSSAITNTLVSQRVRELRDPKPRVVSVTETRYQGLWYGAERIWTGDLVRLAPERQAFSKSLKLSVMTHGDETWQQKVTPSSGAETRGVLMRIDKIFTRIGESGTKECAVAGPVYEIVSNDCTDSAKGSTTLVASSWQLAPQKSVGSRVPTHPWNMAERPPPFKDKTESRAEHILDIPDHTSHVTPSGYALRQLLPPGFEIPVPVSYIAGRYYPQILKSPLLVHALPKIPKHVLSLVDFMLVDRHAVELLSLCALAPGRYGCATCIDVKLASRTGMLEDALQLTRIERQAAKETDSGLERKLSNRMDVG